MHLYTFSLVDLWNCQSIANISSVNTKDESTTIWGRQIPCWYLSLYIATVLNEGLATVSAKTKTTEGKTDL